MKDELTPKPGDNVTELFKPPTGEDSKKALVEAQDALGRLVNGLDETDWSNVQEQLKLAKLFAQLPLTKEDLENIVEQMNLDPGLIAWRDPTIQNIWFSIIQRTFEEGKSVPNLISTTVPYFHEKYGNPDTQGE